MATRLTNRAERLIAVEQLLFQSASGLRAVEIADACGVDRRTVYRDLSLLTEIGVPVFQSDGRFYIDREHYLATVRLNRDETVSLLLAASKASLDVPHLSSALAKLSHALADPFLNHAQVVDSLESQIAETILRAWSEHRRVKLWYSARDSVKTRISELSTYFVGNKPGDPRYVIGFDSLTGRVRAFELSRVQKVEILEHGYQMPFETPPYPIYVRGSSKARGESAELA